MSVLADVSRVCMIQYGQYVRLPEIKPHPVYPETVPPPGITNIKQLVDPGQKEQGTPLGKHKATPKQNGSAEKHGKNGKHHGGRYQGTTNALR